MKGQSHTPTQYHIEYINKIKAQFSAETIET